MNIIVQPSGDIPGYEILVDGKCKVCGLHPTQINAWLARIRIDYERTCQKCGAMGIGGGMPCHRCNKSNKKEGRLKYASNRVGATYPSSSMPGVVYTIRIDKNQEFLSCSCPGFTYHKHCWHRTSFLAERAKKKGKT